MAHTCPAWAGRLLLSPVRKLMENPEIMLSPFVKPGMTVLEPGSGMGFFTLPLAEMVGEEGKVVVLEVQQKMLDGLKKRAAKAELSSRIDARLIHGNGSGLGDLKDQVDFVAAINMVHETDDQERFLAEMYDALKPGGEILIIEPGFHVSEKAFEASIRLAQSKGFALRERGANIKGRKAVLIKHESLL